MKTIEQDNVVFNISTVPCDFMESQPTGESNLALPESWLNKYKPKSGAPTSGAGSAGAPGGKTQLGKEFRSRAQFEESIEEP